MQQVVGQGARTLGSINAYPMVSCDARQAEDRRHFRLPRFISQAYTARQTYWIRLLPVAPSFDG